MNNNRYRHTWLVLAVRYVSPVKRFQRPSSKNLEGELSLTRGRKDASYVALGFAAKASCPERIHTSARGLTTLALALSLLLTTSRPSKRGPRTPKPCTSQVGVRIRTAPVIATSTAPTTATVVFTRPTPGSKQQRLGEGIGSGSSGPLSLDELLPGGEHVVEGGAAVDPDLFHRRPHPLQGEVDLQEIFQREAYVLVESETGSRDIVDRKSRLGGQRGAYEYSSYITGTRSRSETACRICIRVYCCCTTVLLLYSYRTAVRTVRLLY